MPQKNSDVILIISDIHANLEAFQSVLRNSRGIYSDVWLLGDIVGYGPNPRECLQLARKINAKMIAGNHDFAVSEKIGIQLFNEIASTVIMEHRKELTAEEKQFLYNLPTHLLKNSVTLIHGSLRNPLWEYVTNTQTAATVFNHAQSSIIFLGHSHRTLLWTQKIDCPIIQENLETNKTYSLKGKMAIANPGSVGQSRNGDNQAHYMLFKPDCKELSFHSCRWNRRRTRKKMLQKGYSSQLVKFMVPK